MPATLSKLLDAKLGALTCRDVYHPGETCWHAHRANVGRLWPAIAVFFVPLVFVPICRRLELLSWTRLSKALWFYCSMCTCAFVASWLMQVGWCVTHRLLGRFTVWSIIFWPTFLANVSVFMLSEQEAGYFWNTILAPIIESAIRRDWPLVCSSRALQTVAFMSMSVVIMDTKSRMRNDVFWFLEPSKYRRPDDDGIVMPSEPREHDSSWLDWLFARKSKCRHSQTCDTYICSGAWTYFNIGLVLELVRIGFGSAAQIRSAPQKVFSVVASKIKFSVIAFLVAYATLYRTLNCSLRRFHEPAVANRVAALISGSAYLFAPNLTLLSHATAATLKLLWLRGVHTAKGRSKILNGIERLPLSQLGYMACIAYAFHIRVFDARTTAGFIHKTTQMTTGNRFAAIAENIQRLLYSSTATAI